MPSNNDPTTVKSDQAAAAGDSPAGGNNMKKSNMQRDGAAAKGAKPPRRKGKRASSKHKKNRSRNDGNLKRRGGRKPLRRPIIIPEARVVQAPSECSFISDHEDEEEEREIQESIRRHVRVFSYSRNPECFNLVYHSNAGNGSSDDEGVNGYWIWAGVVCRSLLLSMIFPSRGSFTHWGGELPSSVVSAASCLAVPLDGWIYEDIPLV